MSFAVLYLPLVEEFDASRAGVALVQSAALSVIGFSSPLIGWAFDRLGPRRLLPGGALLAAGAFVVASRLESLPALVVVYGVVAGLGLAAFGGQPNMILAVLWYPRARGRAIAAVDLGTGLGAFCFLPLAQGLVTAFGWRGTLLVWAAVLVAVVVPLNLWQRVPPPIAETVPAPGRETGEGWTLAAALRAPAFWWLGLMRFAGAVAFPVMNTHMVAYAIGQGVPATQAATALGAVSLVSLAGRMSTGVLCDRIGRAQTLTIMYTSCAVGIGCLSLVSVTGSSLWLVAYVAFYGFSQGSTGIVTAARSADVFAGATFGSIFGWMGLTTGAGEALGAWAGGKVFDVTGSYLPAFGLAVAALAVGVASIWRVRPDPRRSRAVA
jgi:predicted MFS family arabinose efflux permease